MKRFFATVILLVLLLPLAIPQEQDQEQGERAVAQKLYQKITTSKNVPWLEQVVSGQAAGLPDPAITQINVSALQSLAYIRLGEIASKESIEAIHQIEDRLRRVVPNAATAYGQYLSSAARHEGGMSLKPIVQAKAPDGTVYGLVAGDQMGDLDLFLITSSAPGTAVWTRPLLIPNRIYRGVSDPTLEMRGNDELVFRFVQHEPGQRNIMEGHLEPPKAAAQMGQQEWRLSVAELRRDSDGDGLTDIEEERLGLDAKRADTDGDGIPDGQDICPNLALKDAVSGEDADLVQKAFTAIYALRGSREVMFVSSEVTPRVHFYGYGGSIIYGVDYKQWHEQHPEGGMFLSWKIKQHSSAAAVVKIEDYEGPLAAWGTDVKLKKVAGEWVVIGTENEWIS